MKYKAVIADVDGTLIPPGIPPGSPLSKRLIQAVRAVQNKGIVFSLASARFLGWVQWIVDALGITGPIIIDNGARIYDCGKKRIIWESLLLKEKALEIYRMLKKDRSVENIFMDQNNIRVTNESELRDGNIVKVVVLNIDPKKAEGLYQKLSNDPLIHVTKSVSQDFPRKESIHVTAPDATKQLALGRFVKLVKISPSEIIGIGDSYNDFPLLAGCGLKVVMQNGVDELKKIADYICPSYTEDGVAHVLEKFILNKNE